MGSSRRHQRPGPVRTRPPGPWKHGPIPVIGVVGGIGAGKSAVAARFGELGGFVIDADKVGHALLTQRPVVEELVGRFGAGVLAPATEAETEAAGRTIDRAALGAIVFADPASRRSLESVLHPRMRTTFMKAIDRTIRRGQFRAVVLDAAILFEAGWDGICDRVVFVDAPDTLRLERVEAQRGWSAETLAAREKAQRPLGHKRTSSHVVVTNAGDLDALREAADRGWIEAIAAFPRPERDSSTGVEIEDELSVPNGQSPKAAGRPRPRPRSR